MNVKKLSKIKGESGIALVVALLIMVLITILGTAAIMTSTTDLKISQNFKKSSDSFYAAEAGIEAGMDFLGSNYDSTNGWNDELGDVTIIAAGTSIGPNAFYTVTILDDDPEAPAGTANPDGLSWVTDENDDTSTDNNQKVIIRSVGTYGATASATATLEAYIEFDQGYDSYGGKDLTSGGTNVATGKAVWGS